MHLCLGELSVCNKDVSEKGLRGVLGIIKRELPYHAVGHVDSPNTACLASEESSGISDFGRYPRTRFTPPFLQKNLRPLQLVYLTTRYCICLCEKGETNYLRYAKRKP